MIRKLLCLFGFHKLWPDPRPAQGIWHAYCKHCNAKFKGQYDPSNGETYWARSK